MSLIPAAVLPMPYLPAGSPLRVFLYLFASPQCWEAAMRGERRHPYDCRVDQRCPVDFDLAAPLAGVLPVPSNLAVTGKAGSYPWREPTGTGTR